MTQAIKIIDALDGTSALAKALNLTPSTVSSWKTSGKIPRWWMPAIEGLAKDRGLDLNNLPDPESAAA